MGRKKKFSFIDFAMVIVISATLTRIALPNAYAIRQRILDKKVEAPFQKVVTAISKTPLDVNETPAVIILQQKGSDILPPPLEEISLPTNVVLDYVVKLDFPGFFSLSMVEMSHSRGDHSFRFIQVNEKRIQQIIRKS